MRDIEIIGLPCLTSGHNLNLTSDDMADLQRQCISIDKDNDPAPENSTVTKNIPLPQLKEDNSWRSEVIICLGRSKNLHNTSAPFNNYSH